MHIAISYNAAIIISPTLDHQFIYSSGTTRRWWESVSSSDLPYILHTEQSLHSCMANYLYNQPAIEIILAINGMNCVAKKWNGLITTVSRLSCSYVIIFRWLLIFHWLPCNFLHNIVQLAQCARFIIIFILTDISKCHENCPVNKEHLHTVCMIIWVTIYISSSFTNTS